MARATLLFALGLGIGGEAFAMPGGIGPTVRDIVEFTRIIEPANRDNDLLRGQVSPDGKHAFIVTRKADVGTDRNLFEILLLDVQAEHLQTGRNASPRPLLRVASTTDAGYAEPALSDVRWVGSRTLVLMASIDDAPAQVYKIDVATGLLTQLTYETRPLVSFAVSDDLSRVVYAVQIANPPLAPGARSVVVASRSFWSVKFGQNDLRSQERRYQFLAIAAGERTAREIGPIVPAGSGGQQSVSLSPDGRWALLPHFEPERQAEWAKRYPLIGELTRLLGTGGRADPLGYYSHQTSYTVRTTMAYRLADGHAQKVVDAPDDAMNGSGQVRPDRIWFGGGRSVVIAGTHLPIEPGRQDSVRSQIIEYWPGTGRWTRIAELWSRLEAAYRLKGAQDAFVALDGKRRRTFVRQADGQWRETTDTGSSNDDHAVESSSSPHGWTLRVREALDQPPDIVADGPDGKTVQLTELNPQFLASTWGVTKPFTWKDAHGREWKGGLMVPSGQDLHGPQPLVIQSYGFSPSHFYLDGANVYDGYTSGFAGRAFLREGILVLALPTRPSGDFVLGRPALSTYADGVRSAVDALAKQGIVDRQRVGVMGWSATGEQVLNLVTFSDVPIRAATLLDGDANTLFSLTVTYGSANSIWARKERTNEGLPFGPTQPLWAKYDPSLHTDCVKAALRIETYGPWVLNNWDIYALLRRQYKAAEMVVLPGGEHDLSRPGDRMVSLQGNVDWYAFWLREHERDVAFLPGEDASSLKAQYARWHQMEELKRVDDARPACVRSWSE